MASATLGEGRANRGGRLRKAQWFDHLPEISVEVECSGTSHRVSWHRGKLYLHDHDVEAEETLEALGGEPVYCLALLEAWREEPENADSLEILLSEDLDWDLQLQPKIVQLRQVLQTISKGITTQSPIAGSVQIPGTRAHVPASTFTASGIRGSSVRAMYEKELRRHILFAAPYELRKMLGLATLVHMVRKWEADKHFRDEYGPVLESVLTRRALPALEANIRSWNPRMAARSVTTFECWPSRSDEEAVIAGLIGTDGGFAIVSLPFTWLIDVWSRDIAHIDDCFILAAREDESDETKLRLLAARWERSMGRSVPVVSSAVAVRGSDGKFHLSWGF